MNVNSYGLSRGSHITQQKLLNRKGNLMMKTLGICALIVGMTLTPAIASEPSLADINAMQTSNVQVDLGSGLCSGQIVFSKAVDHKADGKTTSNVETYVLTAKHCTKDLPSDAHVWVDMYKHNDKMRQTVKEAYDANVYVESYASDLSLLKLRNDQYVFPTTPTADDTAISKLRFGQDVVTIGYPLGRSQTVTEGKLGFVEDADGFFDPLSNSHQFLRATPDIAPGSSGGAMFGEVSGKWVQIGVVTGGWNVGAFMNYYTPADEIAKFLKDNLPSDKPTEVTP